MNKSGIAVRHAGPWIFEVMDEGSKRDLRIDSPVAIWIAQEGIGGEVVATVEDVSMERAIANAVLIAAAPDLLAKLKETFAGRACSCRLEPLVGGPVPCTTCQMGHVIAKAEGAA